MAQTEKKEYAPLTAEQKKTAEWRYIWRYVYPGLVLLAILLLPYDTTLIAGIGMVPYTLATFLLSLKPSPVLVFAMQDSKHETLHMPEDEAEAKKYRSDGKILTVFFLILTVAFFVLWLIRRNRV